MAQPRGRVQQPEVQADTTRQATQPQQPIIPREQTRVETPAATFPRTDTVIKVEVGALVDQVLAALPPNSDLYTKMARRQERRLGGLDIDDNVMNERKREAIGLANAACTLLTQADGEHKLAQEARARGDVTGAENHEARARGYEQSAQDHMRQSQRLSYGVRAFDRIEDLGLPQEVIRGWEQTSGDWGLPNERRAVEVKNATDEVIQYRPALGEPRVRTAYDQTIQYIADLGESAKRGEVFTPELAQQYARRHEEITRPVAEFLTSLNAAIVLAQQAASRQGVSEQYTKAMAESQEYLEKILKKMEDGRAVSKEELEKAKTIAEYVKESEAIIEGIPVEDRKFVSIIFARGLNALKAGKASEAQTQRELAKEYAATKDPDYRKKLEEWSKGLVEGKFKPADVAKWLEEIRPVTVKAVETKAVERETLIKKFETTLLVDGKPKYANELGEIRELDKKALEYAKKAEEARKGGDFAGAKEYDRLAKSYMKIASTKLRGLEQIIDYEKKLVDAGAPPELIKSLRASFVFFGTDKQWRGELAIKVARFLADDKNKWIFKSKAAAGFLGGIIKFLGVLSNPDKEVSEEKTTKFVQQLEPQSVAIRLTDAGAPPELIKAVNFAAGLFGTKDQWKGEMILKAARFFLNNQVLLKSKAGKSVLGRLVKFVGALVGTEEVTPQNAEVEFEGILREAKKKEPEVGVLSKPGREKAARLLKKRREELSAILPYASPELKAELEAEIKQNDEMIVVLENEPEKTITRDDILEQNRRMLKFQWNAVEKILTAAGAPPELIGAVKSSETFLVTTQQWRAELVIKTAKLFLDRKNVLGSKVAVQILPIFLNYVTALADPERKIDRTQTDEDFKTLSTGVSELAEERRQQYARTFQSHKKTLLELYRNAPEEMRPTLDAMLKDTDDIIARFDRGEDVSDEEINWLGTRIGKMEEVIPRLNKIEDKGVRKQATEVYISAFTVLASGKNDRKFDLHDREFDLLVFAAEEIETHPEREYKGYRAELVKRSSAVASSQGEEFQKAAGDLIGVLSKSVSGELKEASADRSEETRSIVIPLADGMERFAEHPEEAKAEDFYRAKTALGIVKEMNNFLSPRKKMGQNVRNGAETIWNRSLKVLQEGGNENVALNQSFLAKQYVKPGLAGAVLEDIEGLSAGLEQDPGKVTNVEHYLQIADKIVYYREKRKSLPKEGQKILDGIIGELDSTAHRLASGEDILPPEKAMTAEGWVRTGMGQDPAFKRYVEEFAEQNGITLDAAISMIAREKWIGEIVETGDRIVDPPKEFSSMGGEQRKEYFSIIELSVNSTISGDLDNGGLYRQAALTYANLTSPRDRDDLLSVCREYHNKVYGRETAEAYLTIYQQKAEYEPKISDRNTRTNVAAYFDLAILAVNRGDMSEYKFVMDMAVGYASWASVSESELTPEMTEKRNAAMKFFEEQLGDYSKVNKRILDWEPREAEIKSPIASGILFGKPVAELLGGGDVDKGVQEMQRIGSETATLMSPLADVEFEKKWRGAVGRSKQEEETIKRNYKRANDWLDSRASEAKSDKLGGLEEYYELQRPLISYDFAASSIEEAKEFYRTGKAEMDEAIRLSKESEEALARGDAKKAEELKTQAIEHARKGKMLMDRANDIVDNVLMLNTGVGLTTKHREAGWLDLGISIKTSIAIGRGVEADAFGEIVQREGKPVPLESRHMPMLLMQAARNKQTGTQSVLQQQAIEKTIIRGVSTAKKEIHDKNITNVVELIDGLIELLPEEEVTYTELGPEYEEGGRTSYIERKKAAMEKTKSKNKQEADQGVKELGDLYVELTNKLQIKKGYTAEGGNEVLYYDAIEYNNDYWSVVGYYYNENFTAAQKASGHTKFWMQSGMDLVNNRITEKRDRMEIDPLISEETSAYGPYFGKSALNTIGYDTMDEARFVVADEMGSHINSLDGYSDEEKADFKRRIEEIRNMPEGPERNEKVLGFINDLRGASVKGRVLFDPVPDHGGLINHSDLIYFDADNNEQKLLGARNMASRGDLSGAADYLVSVESDMEVDAAVQREDNRRLRSKVMRLSIKREGDNLENDLPPVVRQDDGRGRAEKEDAEEARAPLITAMKDSRYRHSNDWAEAEKKFEKSRDQLIRTRKIPRATPEAVIGMVSFIPESEKSKILSNGKTYEEMIKEVESAKTPEERTQKAQELFQAIMSDEHRFEFIESDVAKWAENAEAWKQAEKIFGNEPEEVLERGGVDLDPVVVEKMVRSLPVKTRKKKKLSNGKTYTEMLLDLGYAKTPEEKKQKAAELYQALASEPEDYARVVGFVKTRNDAFDAIPSGPEFFTPFVAQSYYGYVNGRNQQYRTAWAYQLTMFKKFDEQLGYADASRRSGRGGLSQPDWHLGIAGDVGSALLTAASPANDYRFYDLLVSGTKVPIVPYNFRASKERPWHDFGGHLTISDSEYEDIAITETVHHEGYDEIRNLGFTKQRREEDFGNWLAYINYRAGSATSDYIIARNVKRIGDQPPDEAYDKQRYEQKVWEYTGSVYSMQTDFELGMLGVKRHHEGPYNVLGDDTFEEWNPTDKERKLYAESFGQFMNVRNKTVNVVFGYSDSWGRNEEEEFLDRTGERMHTFHRASSRLQEYAEDDDQRARNYEAAKLDYGLAVPFTLEKKTDEDGMEYSVYEDPDEFTNKYVKEMEEERSDHNTSNMIWKIVRLGAEYALSPFTFGATGAAATAELTYDGIDAAATYYEQTGGWEYMSGSQKGRFIFLSATAVAPGALHIGGSIVGAGAREAAILGEEAAVGGTEIAVGTLSTGQRVVMWGGRAFIAATTVDLALQLPDMWRAYKRGEMTGLEFWATLGQGALPVFQTVLHSYRVAGIKSTGMPTYRPIWLQVPEALLFGEPFSPLKEHRLARAYVMARREFGNLEPGDQASYLAYKAKYGIVFPPGQEAVFLKQYREGRKSGRFFDFENFATNTPEVKEAAYRSRAIGVLTGKIPLSDLSEGEYVYVEAILQGKKENEAIFAITEHDIATQSPEVKANEELFHAVRQGKIPFENLKQSQKAYVLARIAGATPERAMLKYKEMKAYEEESRRARVLEGPEPTSEKERVEAEKRESEAHGRLGTELEKQFTGARTRNGKPIYTFGKGEYAIEVTKEHFDAAVALIYYTNGYINDVNISGMTPEEAIMKVPEPLRNHVQNLALDPEFYKASIGVDRQQQLKFGLIYAGHLPELAGNPEAMKAAYAAEVLPIIEDKALTSREIEYFAKNRRTQAEERRQKADELDKQAKSAEPDEAALLRGRAVKLRTRADALDYSAAMLEREASHRASAVVGEFEVRAPQEGQVPTEPKAVVVPDEVTPLLNTKGGRAVYKIVENTWGLAEFQALHPDAPQGKKIYHGWEHSMKVAAREYDLAMTLPFTETDRAIFGTKEAKAEYLAKVALLHDLDNTRAEGTKARVPATIEWLESDAGKQWVKEKYGWGDRERLMAEAIIQRTEFPFNDKKVDPAQERTLPREKRDGRTLPYKKENGGEDSDATAAAVESFYETRSPVERYEDLLVRLAEVSPNPEADINFVLKEGAILSEYPDKTMSTYFEPPAAALDNVYGLNDETGINWLGGTRKFFLDGIGQQKVFDVDRTVAANVGKRLEGNGIKVSTPEPPTIDVIIEAMKKDPELAKLVENWQANREMFGRIGNAWETAQAEAKSAGVDDATQKKIGERAATLAAEYERYLMGARDMPNAQIEFFKTLGGKDVPNEIAKFAVAEYKKSTEAPQEAAPTPVLLPEPSDHTLAALTKIPIPGTEIKWGVIPADQLPQWKTKVWEAYKAAYEKIGWIYRNEAELFAKPRTVLIATDAQGNVVAFTFLKETPYGFQLTLVGRVPESAEGRAAATAMIQNFGQMDGNYVSASGSVAAIAVKAGIPIVPFETAQIIIGEIPAEPGSPGARQMPDGKWVRYEAQRGDNAEGMDVIRKLPGFANSDLVKDAIAPDGVRPGAKPEELTWDDLVDQAIRSRKLPDRPEVRANCYAGPMIIDGKPQVVIKTMFGMPREVSSAAKQRVANSNPEEVFSQTSVGKLAWERAQSNEWITGGERTSEGEEASTGRVLQTIEDWVTTMARGGQEFDVIVVTGDKRKLNQINQLLGTDYGDAAIDAYRKIFGRVVTEAAGEEGTAFLIRPSQSGDEAIAVIVVPKGKGEAVRERIKTNIEPITKEVFEEVTQQGEPLGDAAPMLRNSRDTVGAIIDVSEPVFVRRTAEGGVEAYYANGRDAMITRPEGRREFLAAQVRTTDEQGSAAHAPEARKKLGVETSPQIGYQTRMVGQNEEVSGVAFEVRLNVTDPAVLAWMRGLLPTTEKGLYEVVNNQFGLRGLNTFLGHYGANEVIQHVENAVGEYATENGLTIRRVGTLKYVIEGGTPEQAVELGRFIDRELQRAGMGFKTSISKSAMVSNATQEKVLTSISNGHLGVNWNKQNYDASDAAVSVIAIGSDAAIAKVFGTNHGLDAVIEFIRKHPEIRNTQDLFTALRDPSIAGADGPAMEKAFTNFIENNAVEFMLNVRELPRSVRTQVGGERVMQPVMEPEAVPPPEEPEGGVQVGVGTGGAQPVRSPPREVEIPRGLKMIILEYAAKIFPEGTLSNEAYERRTKQLMGDFVKKQDALLANVPEALRERAKTTMLAFAERELARIATLPEGERAKALDLFLESFDYFTERIAEDPINAKTWINFMALNPHAVEYVSLMKSGLSPSARVEVKPIQVSAADKKESKSFASKFKKTPTLQVAVENIPERWLAEAKMDRTSLTELAARDPAKAMEVTNGVLMNHGFALVENNGLFLAEVSHTFTSPGESNPHGFLITTVYGKGDLFAGDSYLFNSQNKKIFIRGEKSVVKKGNIPEIKQAYAHEMQRLFDHAVDLEGNYRKRLEARGLKGKQLETQLLARKEVTAASREVIEMLSTEGAEGTEAEINRRTKKGPKHRKEAYTRVQAALQIGEDGKPDSQWRTRPPEVLQARVERFIDREYQRITGISYSEFYRDPRKAESAYDKYAERIFPEELGLRQDLNREMSGIDSWLLEVDKPGSEWEGAHKAWTAFAERELSRISKLPTEFERKEAVTKFLVAADYLFRRAAEIPSAKRRGWLKFIATNPKAVEYALFKKRGILLSKENVEITNIEPLGEDRKFIGKLRTATKTDNFVSTFIDMLVKDPIASKWFDDFEGRGISIQSLKVAYEQGGKSRRDAIDTVNKVLLPHGLMLVESPSKGEVFVVEVSGYFTVHGQEDTRGFLIGQVHSRQKMFDSAAYFDPTTGQIMINWQLEGHDNKQIIANWYMHETQHLFDDVSGFSYWIHTKYGPYGTNLESTTHIETTAVARETIDALSDKELWAKQLELYERPDMSGRGGAYYIAERNIYESLRTWHTGEVDENGVRHYEGEPDPNWKTRDPEILKKRIERVIDREYQAVYGLAFSDIYEPTSVGVASGEMEPRTVETKATSEEIEKRTRTVREAKAEWDRVTRETPNDAKAIETAESNYEQALVELAKLTPDVPLVEVEKRALEPETATGELNLNVEIIPEAEARDKLGIAIAPAGTTMVHYRDAAEKEIAVQIFGKGIPDKLEKMGITAVTDDNGIPVIIETEDGRRFYQFKIFVDGTERTINVPTELKGTDFVAHIGAFIDSIHADRELGSAEVPEPTPERTVLSPEAQKVEDLGLTDPEKLTEFTRRLLSSDSTVRERAEGELAELGDQPASKLVRSMIAKIKLDKQYRKIVERGDKKGMERFLRFDIQKYAAEYAPRIEAEVKKSATANISITILPEAEARRKFPRELAEGGVAAPHWNAQAKAILDKFLGSGIAEELASRGVIPATDDAGNLLVYQDPAGRRFNLFVYSEGSIQANIYVPVELSGSEYRRFIELRVHEIRGRALEEMEFQHGKPTNYKALEDTLPTGDDSRRTRRLARILYMWAASNEPLEKMPYEYQEAVRTIRESNYEPKEIVKQTEKVLDERHGSKQAHRLVEITEGRLKGATPGERLAADSLARDREYQEAIKRGDRKAAITIAEGYVRFAEAADQTVEKPSERREAEFGALLAGRNAGVDSEGKKVETVTYGKRGSEQTYTKEEFDTSVKIAIDAEDVILGKKRLQDIPQERRQLVEKLVNDPEFVNATKKLDQNKKSAPDRRTQLGIALEKVHPAPAAEKQQAPRPDFDPGRYELMIGKRPGRKELEDILPKGDGNVLIRISARVIDDMANSTTIPLENVPPEYQPVVARIRAAKQQGVSEKAIDQIIVDEAKRIFYTRRAEKGLGLQQGTLTARGITPIVDSNGNLKIQMINEETYNQFTINIAGAEIPLNVPSAMQGDELLTFLNNMYGKIGRLNSTNKLDAKSWEETVGNIRWENAYLEPLLQQKAMVEKKGANNQTVYLFDDAIYDSQRPMRGIARSLDVLARSNVPEAEIPPEYRDAVRTIRSARTPQEKARLSVSFAEDIYTKRKSK